MAALAEQIGKTINVKPTELSNQMDHRHRVFFMSFELSKYPSILYHNVDSTRIRGDNGKFQFIPGIVVPAGAASGGSGKAKRAVFHAGQFIHSDEGGGGGGDADLEFVHGQVIHTPKGPKFVRGETVVTVDGVKFIAGSVRTRKRKLH